MTEAIKCNLTENALDYLILAGEQAKEGSPRMMKHALATLADGVELLLKARLEVRDWCLVFKDVDQASEDKYKSGDFQSVAFDQAVVRLKNLCSVEISKQHVGILNELRQIRNRIRHFALNADSKLAISLITKAFSFALDFVSQHLEVVQPAIQDEMDQLRSLLSEFEEFVDERLKQIKVEKDSYKHCTFLDCPTCLQTTFFADEGTTRCLFCGHRADGEAAAHEWADRFCRGLSLKDSLISPPLVQQCPKCDCESCVDVNEETDGRLRHICFSCGESGEYEPCSRCGRLHADDNPGNHCSDCWYDITHRDD